MPRRDGKTSGRAKGAAALAGKRLIYMPIRRRRIYHGATEMGVRDVTFARIVDKWLTVAAMD